MPKVLGIDTSNYTTSVAVVEEDKLIYDARKILNVKLGEKGLRQSEALFQHVNNMPLLLNDQKLRGISCVCVSTKPRPLAGSYMPVFKAGESIAKSIAYTKGIPIFETTHQEGHLEAAVNSISFEKDEFIALHLSGGTSEILKVKRGSTYSIEIIGGSKDISFGQFIDRIGVAMGLEFPAGKSVDNMALSVVSSDLRIPSRVDKLYFNLSGQETMGLKYINEGKKYEEVAYAAMLCACKTLEKVFNNLIRYYELPILLTGGVASSKFMKAYFKNKFKGIIYFSEDKYAADNASGVAFIGYRKYMEL